MYSGKSYPVPDEHEEMETSPPFVNEECGDTMWDEVLENLEKNNSEESSDTTA